MEPGGVDRCSAVSEARAASPAERLRTIVRRFAAVRRRDGPDRDIDQVMALLRDLETALSALKPEDARTACRAELIALLDEVGRLHDLLADERAALAGRLDLSGRHRRAGAAYQRARGR